MLPVMRNGFKKLSAREVFARNLRLARRLKDLSQEALGLEAGLSRAYVSSVEGGGRNISVDNMELLAQALQLPLRDLVDPDKFKLNNGTAEDCRTSPKQASMQSHPDLLDPAKGQRGTTFIACKEEPS